MTRPALVAMVLLTAASLAAQTPAGGTPASGDRIEQRSQAMREQIGTGQQVQSHVRVSVRLKNGNRLKGVVKDGKLVERVDGLRFVDAQAKESGAGIRLWYSTGARNYVFVPFEGLAEYQVLQRLTPKQLEQIEQEMQMEETARAEKLRVAAEQAQAEAHAAAGEVEALPAVPGQEPTPGTSKLEPVIAPKYETPQRRAANKAKAKAEAEAAAKVDEAAAAEKTKQKSWFELAQEFPPSGGWNEKKRDEIARRKVVVGVPPSEKEQRFVDKYDEWKKACALFELDAEPKAGGPGAGGTGTGTTTETTEQDTGKKSRSKKS